jgi:hypothetical protein
MLQGRGGGAGSALAQAPPEKIDKREKLTNGRRSAAHRTKKPAAATRKRRPILDVHDVKQPDAKAASCVTQLHARR